MKKALLLILITAATLLGAQENWLSYNLDGQVLVEDAMAFSKDITTWAEDAGGYYTQTSPQLVMLRFPWEQVPQFREWLNQSAREVYRLDQSSHDLREEIMNLRSGIEAREEVLVRNQEYLNRSDFEGTLALEQEIRRLMQEIDSRKGQLRRRENDRAMASAVIYISFLNNSLPERGNSSFPWINQVDAYQFLSQIHPETQWKTVSMELPPGFALQREGRLWQAVTPEGIRLQFRWLENYPEMPLEFWEDAMGEELARRGYLVLAEKRRIQNSRDTDMSIMEWGIPYGQQDYKYLTGILVSGKKLLVMEMAGPILETEEYEEPLLESIGNSLR